MSNPIEPEGYEAWYHTQRGAWIAEREFALMHRLLNAGRAASVLDVGCGTGHFSRRFASAGCRVTGLDPDGQMIRYARRQGEGVAYLCGDALALPFPDASFDFCVAVTSLCFVAPPEGALGEMWRVCRYGVMLGLLNRRSLLYRRKRGRGAYQGARWDATDEVDAWWADWRPAPRVRIGTAIFLPGGGRFARLTENLLPRRLPWGAFLAVALHRPEQ